ncbi:MAG: PilT/PilU family type 4a pilus ATPase [Candidatus Absconditabacteria bacterium]
MSPITTGINIEQILSQIAGKENISDIHLSAEEFIALRVSGDIKKITNQPKLTDEMMEIALKQLMKGNNKAFEQFLADREADFSYVGLDSTPYRVNAFFKLGKIGVVLRKINSVAKNIDDLMLPELAESIRDNILSQKQGLFLVTGPTGSGKSTSLVAMIDFLNQERSEHIITIEDPVEFIFEPKSSLISQREVGHDTWAFMNALRSAMREDPDIVLVGEIRDKETAEAVLNLAETGHFVFSTLHTSSASGTISRFISFFPPEIQDSVASRLGDVLVGVQSQRLVKNKDGKGRIGLYEVLINTPAVKNNIKKRQLSQIDNIIETGIKQGMISLEQYTKRLISDGLVDEDHVSWIFNHQ